MSAWSFSLMCVVVELGGRQAFLEMLRVLREVDESGEDLDEAVVEV